MKRQLQLTILLISALTLTFTSAPVAAVTLEARHRKRQHDYDGGSAIDADEQHHGPKQLNSKTKKSESDKSAGKSKSSKKATYLAANTPNPTPTPPPAEELIKLLPDDGARGDKFGYAVSLSGNTLAVGSFLDDDNGSSSGSVYVFVRDGDIWKQQAKILPNDGAAIANFGSAVSLNGDTLAVGAPGDATRGSAYVFVRDGDTWEQQSKILPNDGGDFLDMFGSAVSLSGNTLAVGAWGDDFFSGSVFIFVRDGDTWEQKAEISGYEYDEVWFDRFGHAVSLIGSTLGVGAPGNGYATSGAAYVFVRDGDTWEKKAALLPDDGTATDKFGSAVSLNGNTLAVGASGNDDDSGSVYVFIRDGDTDMWKQQAKLLPNDGAAGDRFGYAVSLSGNAVAIGAYDDTGISSGSVYVFVRSGDTWEQEAKLLPNDGAEGDEFGSAVSLSGNAVVIGAVGDDDKGSNSGSAYVFPLV